MSDRLGSGEVHETGAILELINVDKALVVVREDAKTNCIFRGNSDQDLKALGVYQPGRQRPDVFERLLLNFFEVNVHLRTGLFEQRC